MTSRGGAVAFLCGLMLLVFAYSFWIAAQKPVALGGPEAVTD